MVTGSHWPECRCWPLTHTAIQGLSRSAGSGLSAALSDGSLAWFVAIDAIRLIVLLLPP